MVDFGINFAAIPHGRGVEIRSLSLEGAKPSPTSRQAVGRLWKSAAQVPSGARWKSVRRAEGCNANVGEIGDEHRGNPPRRVRDVERREEKPRRERRRVGSRSLGGRRGTHANRNNATDGQTPEIKTLPHRQDRPLESGRLAANAATVREKQPFDHHLPGPSHPARAGLVAQATRGWDCRAEEKRERRAVDDLHFIMPESAMCDAQNGAGDAPKRSGW